MSIGLIGAGKIGSTLAKLAVSQGRNVVLSNSRGPETLTDLVKSLGPLAKAGHVADACKCDIVVVTIPLKAYKSVPADLLVGKIVIDTNNYYPRRDGAIPELDDGIFRLWSSSSSELLQTHLKNSKVVKAFNTIYFSQLASEGLAKGKPERRALPIAGDDPNARKTVAELIDSFGFDVVDLGPLKEGRFIQPNSPVYNVRLTSAELKAGLKKAGWNGE